MTKTQQSIALYLPSVRGGGMERVFLHLAHGFLDAGYKVDLVINSLVGEHLDKIDPRVQVFNLKTTSFLCTVRSLARYLRENNPHFILSGSPRPNANNIIARWLANYRGQTFISEHSTIMDIDSRFSVIDYLKIRISFLLYPFSSKIITVSDEIANDLVKEYHISPKKITRIYNPIDLIEISKLSGDTPNHDWFHNKDRPIIVNIGRLVPDKDHPTLIRAFALLIQRIPARLLILGEGPERSNLIDLINKLGVSEYVELAGFQSNVFSFLKHSDLFVLSSKHEGFGLVIAEALACGTPVVSTNCKSGPAEILENGVYGCLTPVGSVIDLANAMESVILNGKRNIEGLNRAKDFSLEKVIKQYLELANLPVDQREK